ncbi:hypothetical protein BKA63DRAFT_581104 [Paraphoma chrysanthemicola]|nr:hypothetical protein BKA63DRAFT_581104 [Paraphoma chrysanthemicola]
MNTSWLLFTLPIPFAPTVSSPSRPVDTMHEQTDFPPHISTSFSWSSDGQVSPPREQALSLPRTQDARATYALSQSQPTTAMPSTASARAAETNLQAQAANRLRTHYWQTLTPLVNARTGEPIQGFPLNAFQV